MIYSMVNLIAHHMHECEHLPKYKYEHVKYDDKNLR